jgi:GNAT superfamily N-acetyltransferase
MAWCRDVYQFQYLRVQRHLSDFQTYGLENFVKKVLSYAKDLAYLRFDCCVAEMVPPRAVQFPEPKIDYEIVELIEPMNLSHLIKDLTHENVKYRLSRGEHGFVAMHDKRAIGTLWLTNTSTYFPGFEFRAIAKDKWVHLDRDSGYVYRGAVDKSFHGQGVFHALMNAVVRKSLDLAIKRLVSTHGYDNIAVRKSILKQGWKLTALVSLKRICMIPIRDTYLIEKLFPLHDS